MSDRTDITRIIERLPARLARAALMVWGKRNAVSGACQQNMAAWARSFECTPRHARRLMRELEGVGLVLVEPQTDRDGSRLCNLVYWIADRSGVERARLERKIAWGIAEQRRLWNVRKAKAREKRRHTLERELHLWKHRERQFLYGELGMQILQVLEGQRGADILSRSIQESGAIFERFSPSQVMQFGMVEAMKALE